MQRRADLPTAGHPWHRRRRFENSAPSYIDRIRCEIEGQVAVCVPHGPRRAAGANVAFDVARTVTSPMPRIDTVLVTVTTTVLVSQERSTGQRQAMSVAPLAVANRAASWVGVPVAPKGRNVTGAAASAAASAAPAALVYAPIPAPTAPTATMSTTTTPARATPSPTEPFSPFHTHRGVRRALDGEPAEDRGSNVVTPCDGDRCAFTDRRPATFWNTLVPEEYGFEANVDPGARHPRWSQRREKMIDSGDVFATIKYNGYGDFVADLYG